MKGFRELDPGEAEQVYSSRRRKKEYIDDMEAQLKTRQAASGYDAQPSEETDRQDVRRPGRRVDFRVGDEPEVRPEESVTYDDRGRQEVRGRRTDRRDREDTGVYDENGFYDRGQLTAPPRRQDHRDPAWDRSYEEDGYQYTEVRSRRRGHRPVAEEDPYDESGYRAKPSARRRMSQFAGEEDPYGENGYWEKTSARRRTPQYAEDEDPYEDDGYYEDGYEDDAYEDADYEDVYPDDEADDLPRRNRRRNSSGLLIRRVLLVAAVLLVVTVGVISVFLLRKGRKANLAAQPSESSVQQGANDVELEELANEEALLWEGETEKKEEKAEEEPQSQYLATSPEKDVFFEGYTSKKTDKTEEIVDEDVLSTYAVLINTENGEVIAEKQADAITSPASMTKILTLLVAVEHLSNLDDTVVMTQEVGDMVYRKDLSAVGYQVGDEIPVKDLLYGTILPSGADAALLLSDYVAGSQEAFVAMMNEKVEELGLSETAHFSNTVGIYDPDNHCTMRDMAMILKAAVENELCREVLHTRIYTTSPTPTHPEGIEISNWFLRRIEDKDTHGEVICAKTGFVDQSGCCAASYQISNDGGHYLCVTGDTYSSWRCIYDHVRIYDLYTE